MRAVWQSCRYLPLASGWAASRRMADAIETEITLKPESMRGVPGFFRIGQSQNGAWWLVNPEGRLVFLCAVNDVRGVADSPLDPVARLRTWGFNALGAGAEPTLREEGLPFVASVNFSEAGPTIQASGAKVPDVFDAAWPAAAAANAAMACAPLADQHALIGWITDDELNWREPSAVTKPSLLQICLSLEPRFAAYHAAWEFVLALHRGDLAALAKSWALPITNKEVVREMTKAERGIATRGYLRDDTRWLQEFARRYFTQTSAAIRAQDPHHLIFGCRFRGRTNAALLAECQYPIIDAPWIDLDDLAFVPSGPVIAGAFSWVDARFTAAPSARRGRGLTTVERMLRRGRTVLERAARDPSVIGYAWSQWCDAMGEQPPFGRGLVHINDAEAREHTELLADVNSRVQALRRSVASPKTP